MFPGITFTEKWMTENKICSVAMVMTLWHHMFCLPFWWYISSFWKCAFDFFFILSLLVLSLPASSLLLLLLRLLQTDVLSHHLQRNLIYLDSQVRTSGLSPFCLHLHWVWDMKHLSMQHTCMNTYHDVFTRLLSPSLVLVIFLLFWRGTRIL